MTIARTGAVVRAVLDRIDRRVRRTSSRGDADQGAPPSIDVRSGISIEAPTAGKARSTPDPRARMGGRTPDLRITNASLYQLSYSGAVDEFSGLRARPGGD